MLWTKHFTNSRKNPKIRAIEKKLGEAGYARAFKLFEMVAERGGKATEFSPKVDLRNICTDLEWIAEEWRISSEEAEKTLELFATVDLIDAKAWVRRVVHIPQMVEYLDEYTSRHKRPSNSRPSPDNIGSDSAKSKRQRQSTETEAEAEAEGQRAETAAAAAADLLKKRTEDHWQALGILPCGSPEFQRRWEDIWGESLQSEKASDTMERCIVACKAAGIVVPKPFYDAKRRVEKREAEGSGDENEMDLRARPRGVPEHLMR